MRRIAAAMTASAGLTLAAAQSPHMVTVVQQDPERSPLDAPTVAVSGDGRFIAFVSYARLAPADTNRSSDIYVLDRASGQTTLESLGPDGAVSAADSDHPAISGDGAMLVYETCGEVRLRDRREGVTRVIGAGKNPAISLDGRIIAFDSTAANLGSGPAADGLMEDVFLYEVATGRLGRINVPGGGVPVPSGVRVTPSLSADGRYVAFGAAALAPAGHTPRPLSQVYVRDNQLNTNIRVSEGWRPVISADGRYVAFVSGASNLVAGDRNRSPDVFLADLKTGSIELVSRSASGGSANGTSTAPALSGDARFVAFQSNASDLVCARRCAPADDDINLLWDVFVLDRRDHSMTRLSADATGGWMEPSLGAALDSAGDVIAFSSRHPIDGADVKNDFDLFIVER